MTTNISSEAFECENKNHKVNESKIECITDTYHQTQNLIPAEKNVF